MLSFATPWALLGLIAASIPLLLHLARRHQAPEILFPAVRYLHDATRQQRRRVQIRNWLLLLVRTLLIVALVLAAAGATTRRWSFGPHTATALVLIVDNGAASAAVIDGQPVLDALVRAADGVLDHANASDRLWLLTADGVAEPGSATQLRERLATVQSRPAEVNLPDLVASAQVVLRDANRPGDVVLVGAMPRAEVGTLPAASHLLVLRPDVRMPPNRGVVQLTAGLQPWTPSGGTITLRLASSDTVPIAVTLSLDDHLLRDVLITPGVASLQRVTAARPGWHVITASIPPDEFRLDDDRSIALRVAPPPRVHWDSTDHFTAVAATVLAADGRIHAGAGAGADVTVGTLAAGASVVEPPDDPARIGTVNRALAARGSDWHYGQLIIAAQRFDSGSLIMSRDSVSRRYVLQRDGNGGHVLATVGGEPWAVVDSDVVLLGSRLDPSWTALPVSAAFVPMLDAVLTRVARDNLFTATIVPGSAVMLPDRATTVVGDTLRETVRGGSTWTARAPGVFHLLAGADTLGAITVQLDARVSDLTRATDRMLRAAWPGATITGLTNGASRAFAAGGRADLRGALLLLAVICALAETWLAGRLRNRN
jgi:hypothetical protein